MPQLSVWPEDVSLSFEGEVNLLERLVEAGIPIAHLCGAKARCSTCRVRVIEGLEQLSPRTDEESAMAERLDFPEEIRLACQTNSTESVGLWRLVLDKTDIELASQLGRHKLVGPVGREVEVAVLFTDVVGYTAMADHLPAYDIVHLINRFFARVTHAVEDNRGRVDKYIGDAVMAVFGVEGHEDAAAAAVSTALEIGDIAADLSKYFKMIYGFDFEVRVGIAYGEVIFGLMGAEEAARETVIGDIVNLASRLEAANKETGTRILVSQSVRDRCGGRFEFGGVFDLDVKGVAKPVKAYEVMGRLET